MNETSQKPKFKKILVYLCFILGFLATTVLTAKLQYTHGILLDEGFIRNDIFPLTFFDMTGLWIAFFLSIIFLIASVILLLRYALAEKKHKICFLFLILAFAFCCVVSIQCTNYFMKIENYYHVQVL